MQLNQEKKFTSKLDLSKAKIAIIVSEFNETITNGLLNGATTVLKEQLYLNDSVLYNQSVSVYKVPGAFELLYASHQLVELKKFDAIITLGAIIKGATDHYEYLSQAVSNGMSYLAATAPIPVIFGVLTSQNLELAVERSLNDNQNKGAECAHAALMMLEFNKLI